MVRDPEKHVAILAVSRYGADSTRVRQALQSVLQAQAQGQRADFLDFLVAEQLLTPAQANELRGGLDRTHMDPVSPNPDPPPSPSQGGEGGLDGQGNARPTGTDTPRTTSSATPRPPTKTARSPAGPGVELRNLGDYRLLRRLGEGGMGAVYLGYHESDKLQVAIKVLNENLSSNQSLVDRFYREARSGALLDHPNIVRNVAVGQDRATGKHYLVLEYVDGPSAHALLNQFGRLSVGDAVHLVLDVARALEHAHSRNIVHRDIKPDNILITQSGIAKLADLGLAKRIDEASHLTAARQGFGTPYYMPYEQAMNAKSVDGRSDIYALGATLYHLVTGELPFPGTSHMEVVEKKSLGFFSPASAVNPQVPEVLDRILDKMLAREPRDRYQTASELIVDLDRSNLAAPVPSFTDPDRALQDPLVRARLTSPAQPTSPDLEKAMPRTVAAQHNGNPDLWYLRYRDRNGQWCKAKATTRQVLQRLREDRMPGEVEAAHQPQGKFQPLTAFPEFHEAALGHARRKKPHRPARPAPPAPARARSQPPGSSPAGEPDSSSLVWLAGLGLAIALATLVLVYLIYLA
jgi:eukaryotic-like serine/threonine-protein kinase